MGRNRNDSSSGQLWVTPTDFEGGPHAFARRAYTPTSATIVDAGTRRRPEHRQCLCPARTIAARTKLSDRHRPPDAGHRQASRTTAATRKTACRTSTPRCPRSSGSTACERSNVRKEPKRASRSAASCISGRERNPRGGSHRPVDGWRRGRGSGERPAPDADTIVLDSRR